MLNLFKLKQNTKLRLGFFLLLTMLLPLVPPPMIVPLAEAQSPNLEINYQGKLLNASSSPVTNGAYSMVFRLYTVPTGGTHIWSETQSVPVTSGLFSVMLGDVTSLASVDFNQTLYLGVTVGTDSEMSPRKVLGAVPAAFVAETANELGGVASSSFLRSDQADVLEATSASTLLTVTQNGAGNILDLLDGATNVFTVRDGGNVGIGTTTPGSRLTVAGDVRITGALRDSNNSAGTSGFVLQTTGSGTQWVATSSLGFSSQTLSLGTDNQIPFVNSAGSDLEYSANFTFDGTNLVLGTDVGLSRGAANRLDLATGDSLNLVSGALQIFGTNYLTGNNTSRSVTLGEAAGSNLTNSTIRNVAIGYQAGAFASNSNADYNVYIGNSAGVNNTGLDNVIIGNTTGSDNTGNYNTLLGSFAGASNTGNSNNLVGYYAGGENRGLNNNIIGLSSGYNNTGRSNNIFGESTAYNNSGSYSEFIGFEAAGRMSASNTIAIGQSALRGGSGSVTSGNTATTTNNTALGAFAGYSAQTGADNNLLLGYRSGYSLTTGANNIIIGYDVEAPSNTGSNQLNIGNLLFGTGIDGTGTTLSTGNIGIGTSTPTAKLDVWGNFRVGTSSLPSLLVDTSANQVVIGTTTAYNSGGLYLENSAITLRNTGNMSRYGSVSMGGLGYLNIQGSSIINIGGLSGPASSMLQIDPSNGLVTINGGEGDYDFRVRADSGNNLIAADAGTENVTFEGIGNVGIGTTTPSSKLTVAGDVRITGALRDSSNSAGTNGFVLQSTGTGFAWVATSTLGISGGSSVTFGTDNQIPFMNSGGTDFEYASTFTYDGTNLNLGVGNGLAIGGSRVLYASSTTNSLAVGLGAGSVFGSSANTSTAIGNLALASSTGADNTALGYAALTNNVTGGGNTALGALALYTNTGDSNVAIGGGAMYSNNTGGNNTAIGRYSLETNVSGFNNVALGFASLNVATANNNTAIGYSSGLAVTSGANNLLLGYQAADSLTTGANNIVIGYDVEAPSNTGSNQLNIGNLLFGTGIDGTGTTLSTGNIGIGTTTPTQKLTIAGNMRLSGALYDRNNSAGTSGYVLQSTGTGTQWVATSSLGISGGSSLTFGTDNQIPFMNAGGTDFEYSSGFTYNGTDLNLGGTNGIAFGGTRALTASTTLGNYLFGDGAGGALTTGTSNIGIGSLALENLTTGTNNVAIGNNTGRNTTGQLNTFIGGAAAFNNTSGSNNTFVGYAAGFNNTIGSRNSFFGEYAGNGLVAGDENTFLGQQSALNLATSSNTVAIGYGAAQGSASYEGQRLTVVGYRAGASLATGGNNNILLGYQAGDALTTGANNIVIGYDVEAPSNTGSNQLNIGNLIFGTGIDGTGTTLSSGNIGIGTTTPSAKLTVAGDSLATGRMLVGSTVDTDGVINLTQAAGLTTDGILALEDTFSDFSFDTVAAIGSVMDINPDTNYTSSFIDGISNVVQTRLGNGFNLGQIAGINNSLGHIGNGTVTDMIGEYIEISNAGGGTITNTYGVYVGDVTSGTQTNTAYAIFAEDSNAFNYFAGNTGIGTSTPSAKLDVVSSAASLYAAEVFNLSTDGFGQYVFVNNTDIDKAALAIDNSAGSIMRVMNNGEVGIGTTDPSAQLDVVTNSSTGYAAEFVSLNATGQGAYIYVGNTSVSTNALQIDNSAGGIFTVLGSGNVGIGTSTPAARLSVQNTTLSGSGVSGIDQYLTTTNSVASAVQFGNRFFLETDNTATTTIVGSIYRVQDSTTFANTLRGLEVQTNRGTNTLGENTALSGFARTFGVRGITSADAGGFFEPAGGFFETEGTTQGNAIRGFSDTITSATLLSLFQASSTFVGTGLEMNFGNTTGSFSSTTASRFIDLQNAGTSVFTVSPYGNTNIGNGTTNLASVQIGYGGLCVDNDGSCAANVAGRIASVSTFSGNSDLAETYFSSEDLEPGEIVRLKGGLSVGRAGSNDDAVIGVVSTKPGLLLGYDDISLVAGEESYPIALAGRVPVRLSTENGPIKRGDQLMLSSIPGVAMKATSTGTVVGTALEDFNDNDSRMYSETYLNQFGDDLVDPVPNPITENTDPRINDGCYFSGGSATGDAPCVPLSGDSLEAQVAEANTILEEESKAAQLAALRQVNAETRTLDNGNTVKLGQIVMFVQLEKRWFGDSEVASIQQLLSTEAITNVGENETETVFDRLVTLANNFVDGVLSILELRVNRVEVADELCVDGVCITADDLRTMLEHNGAAPQAEQGSGGGSSPEPTDPEPTEPLVTDQESTTADESDTEPATSDTTETTPDTQEPTTDAAPEAVTEPATSEATNATETAPEPVQTEPEPVEEPVDPSPADETPPAEPITTADEPLAT